METGDLFAILPSALLEMSVLLTIAVLVGLVARRIHIPLTVVLAIAGLAVGAVGGNLALIELAEGAGFENLLVNLFLPILIFEAALGLNTREFMRNLSAIAALATVALAISAALVGFTLHVGLDIRVEAALLFGVIVAATDPVAVVAVFRELGVSDRLLTLAEGESLLNDGVAIVLYNILLFAALGGALTPAEGAVEFVAVSAGGIIIGAVIGAAAAILLPVLHRLPAAALSIAMAYGSAVLAEAIFGFSGVMATAAAGIVVGGFAPSRASPQVRDILKELWDALAFIANALLFLFIGLAIDPALLAENWRAIALASVAVLIARPIAVVPTVAALERYTHVPRVGGRSSAVLVWGGLRGGVTLALALALPVVLAERDLFIAMAGGVVLLTLLVNATTIEPLVRTLRLNEPSRADRYVEAVARIFAVNAARRQLDRLGFEDSIVLAHLEVANVDAVDELERSNLDDAEQLEVLTRRGLHIERQTYQSLGDAGLLPPIATRTLMQEIDDEVEEIDTGELHTDAARRVNLPWYGRLHRWLLGRLPEPLGEDLTEVGYIEISARRLAAQKALQELERFKDLPNVSADSVEDAKRTFVRWERSAAERLEALEEEGTLDRRMLRRRHAQALSRITVGEVLGDLVGAGVLSESAAAAAQERLVREIGGASS